MSETEKTPIDYDTVKPGDVIPSSRIIELSGKRPGRDAYRIFQLELCFKIMDDLEARNIDIVAVTKKHDIVLLTPAEAVDCTKKRMRKSLRSLVRNHDRMLKIDTRGLDDDYIRKHRRNLEVSGAIVAGFQETPAIRRLAYKRVNPGLESWSGPKTEEQQPEG